MTGFNLVLQRLDELSDLLALGIAGWSERMGLHDDLAVADAADDMDEVAFVIDPNFGVFIPGQRAALPLVEGGVLIEGDEMRRRQVLFGKPLVVAASQIGSIKSDLDRAIREQNTITAKAIAPAPLPAKSQRS